MAAKRGQGKLVTRRLTRGKRKGQVVRGYVGKNGKFTEATKGGQRVTIGGGPGKSDPRFATDKNVQKGNKRRNKTFTRAKSASGQNIHRYSIGGKTVDIVVKAKKKPKTTAKSAQRSAPSIVASNRTTAFGGAPKAPVNRKRASSSVITANQPVKNTAKKKKRKTKKKSRSTVII